jgi:hypothetical protein
MSCSHRTDTNHEAGVAETPQFLTPISCVIFFYHRHCSLPLLSFSTDTPSAPAMSCVKQSITLAQMSPFPNQSATAVFYLPAIVHLSDVAHLKASYSFLFQCVSCFSEAKIFFLRLSKPCLLSDICKRRARGGDRLVASLKPGEL